MNDIEREEFHMANGQYYDENEDENDEEGLDEEGEYNEYHHEDEHEDDEEFNEDEEEQHPASAHHGNNSMPHMMASSQSFSHQQQQINRSNPLKSFSGTHPHHQQQHNPTGVSSTEHFMPAAMQASSPVQQKHQPQNQFYTASETTHLAQKLISQLKHINIAAAVASSDQNQQLPLPLYEIILILNTYRLDCQKRHLYKECDTVDRILRAIRIAEEKRHVESLRDSQHAERMHLDMQHRVEMDQLTKLWDTRFMDFNTYIQELRNSMSERHIQEFEQFKLKFNFELNRVPKFSKRVLNMRAIERTLVGQKKFREAEKVKKKANVVQNQELIEKSQRIAERFEKQKELLLKRHNKEADALQLKIDKIRHDLEQGKSKDFTNAQRRYQNAVQNISKSQNIIMKKTLRYIKTHNHNTKLAGIASTKLPDMRESMNSQMRLSHGSQSGASDAIQQERQNFFNSRSAYQQAQDDMQSIASSMDAQQPPVWAKEKRSKSRGAARSSQHHRLGTQGGGSRLPRGFPRSSSQTGAITTSATAQNGRSNTAIGASRRSRSTQPQRAATMRSHSSMELVKGVSGGDTTSSVAADDLDAQQGGMGDMPQNRKLSPIKSRRRARMKKVAQVYQSKPFGMAGGGSKKKEFVF